MNIPLAKLIPWKGSKAQLMWAIQSLMPIHYNKLVDVFGGSGCVTLNLQTPRGVLRIYNDLDSNLYNMMYCVREKPVSVITELKYMQNSREEFETMLRALKDKDFAGKNLAEELELTQISFPPAQAEEISAMLMQRAIPPDAQRAAMFFLLHNLSYNGLGTEFAALDRDWDRFEHQIIRCARILQHIPMENRSYKDILSKYDAPDTVFYCDPPYLGAEKYDAKEKPPVVITPSQLLQMFAFSKADSGYEETFIKFFASSSVGVSFEYNNNDIQEILSRIGHYNGVSSEVAERILARQIVQSRYTSATDDEEKEEIIYKTVSEELLKELDLTKEQVAALELEKNHLNDDRKAALDLLTENDELFEGEKKKLQAEAEEARKRHAEEADARQQAEQDRQRVKKYSERQEQLYIDEKMKVWKRKHWILLIIGAGLTLTVIVAALLLWKKLNDSGCLGLLGLLTVTIPITIKGGGVLSVKSKSEARQELLDNYRERLKT